MPAFQRAATTGQLPFRVWAVLGNDHLQLPEAAHRRSVRARRELQEQPLLLVGERVHDFPELPTEGRHNTDCSTNVSFWSVLNRVSRELGSKHQEN